MFTGLVETIGIVSRMETSQNGARVTIGASPILDDVKMGDSISVNGICLTVVAFTATTFTVDAVPETLRRSNLGGLRSGSAVHLERALRADARLGGHIVSGHIDGVGRIAKRVGEGLATVLTIEADWALLRYIVEKGSICIDGVSLTVMEAGQSSFTVSIIPHTGDVTLLATAKVGTVVNLECDVIAKYVERLLGGFRTAAPGVTMDYLAEHGFV